MWEGFEYNYHLLYVCIYSLLIFLTLSLSLSLLFHYLFFIGQFRLIYDGDLAEAVAASCAIPYIFQPIPLNTSPIDYTKGGVIGVPPVTFSEDGTMRILPLYYADGGVKDRLGLNDWAKWTGAESETRSRTRTRET